MQGAVPTSTEIELDLDTRKTHVAEKDIAISSAEGPLEEWKAGRQEWLIIITLVVISTMASLDATILVPVLPVSINGTS